MFDFKVKTSCFRVTSENPFYSLGFYISVGISTADGPQLLQGFEFWDVVFSINGGELCVDADSFDYRNDVHMAMFRFMLSDVLDPVTGYGAIKKYIYDFGSTAHALIQICTEGTWAIEMHQEWARQALIAFQRGYVELSHPELEYLQKVISWTDLDTVGYVYVVKSPTGYYKIGRTKNPKDRIATFSVKLPFEVAYEAVIETHDMYTLEKALHEHFASKRGEGEWFLLNDDDLAYLRVCAGAGS